jgi:Leucine-rich repeat (LRR) protein
LNSLSGRVPSLNLSSLTTLILNNNSLTGINNLTCPLLKEINVATNSITAIPSFGGCPSIQTIDMSSNPMSSNPAAYVADTFTPLTALRSLNLANCGLSRSIVDQILVDLGKNYDANPRTRVSVNLVGNASPSATTEIQTFIISRLRSSGWTIGVS